MTVFAWLAFRLVKPGSVRPGLPGMTHRLGWGYKDFILIGGPMTTLTVTGSENFAAAQYGLSRSRVTIIGLGL